ncbi:TIGR03435 family protein [Edaphobacter sp.]|uniref:TIGR03435 family protein n=1 Tax=Edaphobacter sp. TaxID=1934404 RepID=UPI002DBF70D2|nr:TIGR03435 family protein [Edaphobacter sp.]HEU5341203.1 TIGR03435 family protein [Edaphobacter sp.]
MKRGSYLLATAVIVGLMSMTRAYGQSKPDRLTFDVAAIRRSDPNMRNGYIKAMPGGNGYLAQNVPVKLMISLMYKVPMRRIKGAPDWLATDGYDVEAKADHPYSIDDLQVMFQNLLADRFNLKFHKEIKEGPVYALMVDQSGLKMKVDESKQDFSIPMNDNADGVTVGKRVNMRYFCWWLERVLHQDERPVIDKTGLTGNYDFTLSYAPVLPPNVSPEKFPAGLLDRPSIFDALKHQLGLRLEAGRGPVVYYVIDHVERPSAN